MAGGAGAASGPRPPAVGEGSEAPKNEAFDQAREVLSHQERVLFRIPGVGHKLDIRCSGERDDPVQPGSILRGLETEEGIGRPMPSKKPRVDQPAVGPVQLGFLTHDKSKTPSHRGSGRKDPPEDHVQAQVKMLMSVDMGRFPADESKELLELGPERLGHRLDDEGIVDDLGPRSTAEEPGSRF